ncbi:MAG: MerR family DNA-binding transcriptional regulator [Proteobacteria bacterium]|nr:MerR family DNA-binding transcriptional regulator [Pseudomonadota bacterium]
MSKTYTISDLANEFDVTTRTIRFYEEKGFLKPEREGTRRIFKPSDRTKLRLILRGKRLGFSLDESAEIVLMYGSPRNNRKQLEKLVARIRIQRSGLERQQQDLEIMLTDLRDVEDKCMAALSDGDGRPGF